jgi:hypothetical protein
MTTLYVFADEAGDFTFTREPNVSIYFHMPCAPKHRDYSMVALENRTKRKHCLCQLGDQQNTAASFVVDMPSPRVIGRIETARIGAGVDVALTRRHVDPGLLNALPE